jgi:hypothetical protein
VTISAPQPSQFRLESLEAEALGDRSVEISSVTAEQVASVFQEDWSPRINQSNTY